MLSKLERTRLLEPGYPGFVDGEELEFIFQVLCKSKSLAAKWGFKAKMRIHREGILRVAADGSDSSWKRNAALVRPKTSPLRAVKAISRA